MAEAKKTTKAAAEKAEVKKAPAKKAAPKAEAKAEAPKAAKKPATKKAPKATAVVFTATGRRKQSIARVRLTPSTKGSVKINGKHIDEYLALGTLKLVAMQALELVGAADKYDVEVSVHGGGLTGQAGAIRHGIARALVKADETYKAELKKAGFLTRDARVKERKKYGLKKARKAPQFRKR